MLYQSILENATTFLGDDGKPIADAIEKAGRFVFDEKASRALAQLALTKPSRILLAKEFLRLPFDSIWIEYHDAERKALWRERGGEVNEEHSQPVSTGLLIRADPDDPAIVHVWSAWSHESKPHERREPFHFSPLAVSIDLSFERASDERVQHTIDLMHQNKEAAFSRTSHLYLIRNQPEEVASYARVLANAEVAPSDLISQKILGYLLMANGAVGGQATLEAVRDQWREDVSQEIPFVIAALLLLNCRNGVEREAVSFERLNKKRKKSGKAPIRDHSVIRLRVPRGAMGTGSRSYDRRSAHWVMGHPKVRKTGVFWWSPHVRGEAEGSVGRGTRIVKG